MSKKYLVFITNAPCTGIFFTIPIQGAFFGCHPNTKKYKSTAFGSFAPSHEILG